MDMGIINMKAHRQTDLKRPGQLSEPHRRGNFSLSLMSMISFLSLSLSLSLSLCRQSTLIIIITQLVVALVNREKETWLLWRKGSTNNLASVPPFPLNVRSARLSCAHYTHTYIHTHKIMEGTKPKQNQVSDALIPVAVSCFLLLLKLHKHLYQSFGLCVISVAWADFHETEYFALSSSPWSFSAFGADLSFSLSPFHCFLWQLKLCSQS